MVSSWSRESSPVQETMQPIQQSVFLPEHSNELSELQHLYLSMDTHYSFQVFATLLCEDTEAPLEPEADPCPSKQVLPEHSNPQSYT